MPLDLIRQAFDIDSWQPRAACRGKAEEADWFPEVNAAFTPKTKAAKAICARCPVRVECLTYALMMDEQHARGIFALAGSSGNGSGGDDAPPRDDYQHPGLPALW